MAVGPKLAVDVYVRFTQAELEELREIADKDCTSVSSVVRRLVRQQLRPRPQAAVELVRPA